MKSRHIRFVLMSALGCSALYLLLLAMGGCSSLVAGDRMVASWFDEQTRPEFRAQMRE
jgi:hypothetical protein